MTQEWSDTAETITALTEALDTYNWPRAKAICSELVGNIDTAITPFPEKPAKLLLNMLRRKRRFDLMEQVAEAILQAGDAPPLVRRQYAQCLIDQGRLPAARAVLDAILGGTATQDPENAEARGLLGRIYKQLYVNSHDPRHPRQQANLRKAVRHYYDVYQTDPKEYLWHGINSVACLARASRDGVTIEGFPPAADIANQIHQTLERKTDLFYWDRATAIENSVALGAWSAAYDHLAEYLGDRAADAFEIGSCLRQLIEVWELTNDREPGSILLPALKAALLKKEGGSLNLPYRSIAGEAKTAQRAKENLDQASRKKLEKVFGTDGFQPLKWYQAGLNRCKAVGRIESLMGKKVGTGFLVKASDFFTDRSDKELLLLTNAHVISATGFPGALPPEAAMVIFEAQNQTFTVGELVWSSSPDELDATFVTLESLGMDSELCPLKPQAAPFDSNKQQRVYVIGYPNGGGLSFSLQDNIWLDADGTKLHYRTPTNPGSSGSPVFDEENWTVIALHHAGDEEMPRLNGREGSVKANEGIAINAIQKATQGQRAFKSEAGN